MTAILPPERDLIADLRRPRDAERSPCTTYRIYLIDAGRRSQRSRSDRLLASMIPAETLVSRFGRRVRELRNQFGMSQAKLAEGARISTNHVGAIERAEKSSTLDTIEAVARGLRVDPAELLADPPKSAAPADPWAREVLEAAAHVPPHLRPVVIDVLAALARHGTVRGPRRARAAANKRPHSAHPPSPSRIRQRGQ